MLEKLGEKFMLPKCNLGELDRNQVAQDRNVMICREVQCERVGVKVRYAGLDRLGMNPCLVGKFQSGQESITKNEVWVTVGYRR